MQESKKEVAPIQDAKNWNVGKLQSQGLNQRTAAEKVKNPNPGEGDAVSPLSLSISFFFENRGRGEWQHKNENREWRITEITPRIRGNKIKEPWPPKAWEVKRNLHPHHTTRSWVKPPTSEETCTQSKDRKAQGDW